MKKFIFLFTIIAFTFISCEEGFEPIAEFRQDYVMYGIINRDSTYQTVVISKSYQADNFDQYSNTTDPDIKNAVVTIKTSDREYLLRDTSIERTDRSRYTTPEYFYYTNELQPKNRDEIELRAVLPNGKVLTSKTQVPSYSLFTWSDSDNSIPSSKEKIYDQILFRWKLINPSENLMFLPRLLIHYLQKIKGENVKKVKEVPMSSFYSGGTTKEKFPGASGNNYVLYDTTIVYNTIKNLKGGGSASDITIINGEVELTVMDKNFGSYYSSIQTLNDGYTIRIYETNFSNIEGGLGIFGSYFTVRKDIDISQEFINRFGYKSYY